MAGELKLESRPLQVLQETPLVELAHDLLAESNELYYYRDLLQKVAALRQMTEDDVTEAIARLYTDINIDGRFLCVGDNVWGLRRWYPTERTTERGSGKKFLRKDVDLGDDDADDEDAIDLEDDDFIDTPPFGLEEDDVAFDEEEEVLEEHGFIEEDAEIEEDVTVEGEEEEKEEF